MTNKYLLIIIAFLSLQITFSQDIVFEEIINKNSKTFTVNNNNFNGSGWDFISNTVKQSDNVLIGEDHLTNEIPFFIKHITQVQKFDNFYIEVDPYSTEIIENSLTKLSSKERDAFNAKYKGLFSFYALAPEYELLKDIAMSGTKILGSDQIIMYADRLIFQKLIKETKNKQAKPLYKELIEKSETYLKKFFENPQNAMYLMTPEFAEKIKELQQLELSEKEQEILTAMLTSVDIYSSGVNGHKKRIKLFKHHIMKNYDVWKNKRNLFKYGAVHLAKGESLLTIYDIGNLVHNISEANDKKALHIMIIGQSGFLGQPFRTFPSQPVNINKWPFKNLKPFLTASDNQWKVFDLMEIRKAVKKGKIDIDDVTLNRVVKGYDLLVIIPEVTAAKF